MQIFLLLTHLIHDYDFYKLPMARSWTILLPWLSGFNWCEVRIVKLFGSQFWSEEDVQIL